jgi:ubiquitin-conjugating enzyme E2 Z
MTETMKVITNDTVRRLLKDVKQIMKYPLTDNGIYYIHDETDMTKGYAMIIGQSDTPYYGGYYFFSFDYPIDYPFSPPKVIYMTNDGKTRFNPNLYRCGKVCVSILNTWTGDKWTSCQTINSILLTLCSLLNDTPLLNEPGQGKNSRDFISYQKSIEFKNIDFAICDMIINNKINHHLCQMFYSIIKEQFNNNYDKLLQYIKSQSKEVSIQKVGIYDMTTIIDYSTLETKLIKTKQFIDSETI